jgi:hypothetical protein
MDNQQAEQQVEQQAEPGAVEQAPVDWQGESKKFQSMYDRQTADYDTLKSQTAKYAQLAKMLESRPDVVSAMRDTLAGKAQKKEEPKVDADSFDPWEAYSDPGSESYRLRQKENAKMVNGAVKKQMAGLQMQMGMQNLKGELESKYGMKDQSEVNDFMKFAMTPKDKIPIDTLVDVYRKNKGAGQQRTGANENLEATQRSQGIPKSAGILQGAKPERSKNDSNTLFDRLLKSSGSGSRLP